MGHIEQITTMERVDTDDIEAQMLQVAVSGPRGRLEVSSSCGSICPMVKMGK